MTVVYPDLAVLGAGPAGAHAAMAAREAGLSVVLIDEAPHAGGQVYRAPLDGGPGLGSDGAKGDALRHALVRSGVDCLHCQSVWTVSSAPIGLSLAGPGPVRAVRPRAVVVAAGAVERVVPFPGWTLPGVIGLAGATALLKGAGPPPPGPVVVAGRGPLLIAITAGLLARGARVACVVDGASRADWTRALPALLSSPGLLLRGARWLRQIRQAGIPILHGHQVIAARGDRALHSVQVRSRTGRERVLPANLLAVGDGLVPSIEVLALFGVERRHDAPEGAWLPVLGQDGRTNVPAVYATGDGTGIRGAEAAALSGRLTGLAVAHALGALSAEAHAARAMPLRRRLRRAARAGSAMAWLMTPPRSRIAAIPPGTVVCRCEDVTRAEVDAVFAAGARTLDQLKARTRCGMGPCQGRVCAPIVSVLASLHPGVANPPRPWTTRPPLRALPIIELVEMFDYGDIPAVIPAI